MSFRIPGSDQHKPQNIISLFNQLGTLDRISLEQGGTVSEYEEVREQHKDIAIEMPAGHGKTLVGGLIGEFNRRTRNWRVVYACATRQLAYQTGELLNSYGIRAVTLVKKRDDFSSVDLGRYQRGDAIVVTTYSHIFNANPAFSDPNQIIFDDAHAAEYAIQGFWELKITRRKNREQFEALIATLGDSISMHLQDKILHGTYDPVHDGADIIPQALWYPRLNQIRTLLDSKVDGTNLYYPWSRIRSHLHGCQIYLSHSTIAIRPVLPPNLRWPAFEKATERIYMTATIGNGGELERVFGVPKMYRISKFDSSANKVSGRRLILFPEDHFDTDQLLDILKETIRTQPRVLCLCPSESVADDLEEILREIVPEYTVFKAWHVEDSLTPFTSSERGILILNGRYEGIDLKDNDCRLQLFIELPVGIGLADKFLQDRLKATEIFNNLLITRVIQGLGRTTRGANDHAAVLFLGSRIGQYLYKDEFRKMLPAEIDSELELGFSQIDYINDKATWLAAIGDFYAQNENWRQAERYIRSETEKKKDDRIDNPTSKYFRETVTSEMDFMYAIWDFQLEKAHRAADKVVQTYQNTPLNGYRAWWNYLLGCVSYFQGNQDQMKEYHNRAIGAGPYKLWLDRRVFDTSLIEDIVYPEPMENQINAILDMLQRYGDRHNRFDKDLKSVHNGLGAKDSDHYEPAFCMLGKLLGFNAERPTGQGTPDGIWHLLKFWTVFEMKTNIIDPTGEIPFDDIRQTFVHDRYVMQNRPFQEGDEVSIVLICAKRLVPQYAAHATDGIYLVDPKLVGDIYEKLEIVLRTVLEKLKYSTFEDAKNRLGELLYEHKLDYLSLNEAFKQVLLKDAITS
ncbi:DEAD/DEAH box helicase [Paenibacillus sp. FSL H8-0537]|uniref:helicase C-terminal domain-containing protein n=1 Tax=Paenibacillus sp. FSL H8-0537 TaxID=2921399 RepID=UPI0031010E34